MGGGGDGEGVGGGEGQKCISRKRKNNYTPPLHVFSLAAPSVSVRAREQTI